MLSANYYSTDGISFDARQLIYDVMLQRLSLVQKLNVQCRLAREVLGHAADECDEGEELSPALNAALLDTITLLCGPRMKLPSECLCLVGTIIATCIIVFTNCMCSDAVWL